jgi:hypothetical protein
VSDREDSGQAGEIRKVTADHDGSRRQDRTAPVEGGQIRPAHELDINRLIEQLPENAKVDAFKNWQKSQPDSVRAARIARRERIRLFITIVVFSVIFTESAIAVYIAAIAKSSSWDHVKDWLIISSGPFVAAATVTSTFWFPSREAD